MNRTLLQDTIEKVTEWTEGNYLAERIYYRPSNLLAVIIKPFIYELGNKEIMESIEEGHLPQDTYIFMHQDSVELAKMVRRFVVFEMKHTY